MKKDNFFYGISCAALVVAVFVTGVTVGVNLC